MAQPKTQVRLLLATTVAAALVVLMLFETGRFSAAVAPTDVDTKLWVGGKLAEAKSDKPGLRILFVGNSLTSTNNLPSMVQQLADTNPSAPNVFVGYYAPPGGTLSYRIDDPVLKNTIQTAHWDFVVIQEQSIVPSLTRSEREKQSNPYVSRLNEMIRANGSKPVLFQTWGYVNGDETDLTTDTYAAMQFRLDIGYKDLSDLINAPVVPVGDSWGALRAERPDLNLYADNHHPRIPGSYLGASVFYDYFTGRDASSSSYTAGLSQTDADQIRSIAKQSLTN